MQKEIKGLAQAIENLLTAVLIKEQAVAPEVHAPKNEPIAPAVKAAPVVPPAAPAAQGPVTHDEVRALLLPIIQSDQNAMTAVHSVLTQQFKVNELTSLPVAQIPQFMTAVNQALEAAKG